MIDQRNRPHLIDETNIIIIFCFSHICYHLDKIVIILLICLIPFFYLLMVTIVSVISNVNCISEILLMFMFTLFSYFIWHLKMHGATLFCER